MSLKTCVERMQMYATSTDAVTSRLVDKDELKMVKFNAFITARHQYEQRNNTFHS